MVACRLTNRADVGDRLLAVASPTTRCRDRGRWGHWDTGGLTQMAQADEIKALVQGIGSGQIGRREFLRRAAALGISSSLAAAVLAACGATATPTSAPAPSAAPSAAAASAASGGGATAVASARPSAAASAA